MGNGLVSHRTQMNPAWYRWVSRRVLGVKQPGTSHWAVQNTDQTSKITLPTEKRGRQLLLHLDVDDTVMKHLHAIRSAGGVVNSRVTFAVAVNPLHLQIQFGSNVFMPCQCFSCICLVLSLVPSWKKNNHQLMRRLNHHHYHQHL